MCIFGCWVLLEGIGCSSARWVLWGVGGGGGFGNNILACWSASLMVLGVCLYMVLNSCGVNMALVSLVCICVIVVIPYVYSLSRYVWVFLFESSVRLV